jgi:hypothetical protein
MQDLGIQPVLHVSCEMVQDGGGLGVPGPAGHHHGARLLCHGLHHLRLQSGLLAQGEYKIIFCSR